MVETWQSGDEYKSLGRSDRKPDREGAKEYRENMLPLCLAWSPKIGSILRRWKATKTDPSGSSHMIAAQQVPVKRLGIRMFWIGRIEIREIHGR